MPVCRCCFQVDIGCGTSVVGSGAEDKQVPKSDFSHPLSMDPTSYAWVGGRGNWRADPPDYGYYPAICPRYHRFRVIRPGNFTFVSGVALLEDGVRFAFAAAVCSVACVVASTGAHRCHGRPPLQGTAPLPVVLRVVQHRLG